MLAFFAYIVVGVASLIVSMVAMREKTQNLLIAGGILVGLQGLLILTHLRFIRNMFYDQNFLLFLILGAIFVIPIIFLIKSKEKQSADSISDHHDALDGIKPGVQTTEEYLDKIINSPDEEIDFEEDLDLK